MRDAKRDVHSALKELRLNGMASAWADLMEQDGGSGMESSRWLVEHLLDAEDVDRHMRSIAHQMKTARFPMHRDLAGFDFTQAKVVRQITQSVGKQLRRRLSGVEKTVRQQGLHNGDANRTNQRIAAIGTALITGLEA